MAFLVALVLAASPVVNVRVDTAPSHVLNSIRPLRAIGAGVDSDPPGKVPFLYSPERSKLMLDAGFGALSLRLYTELSIQDWHWNPSGSFSDKDRGYWTSGAVPTATQIVDSYGYVLPHRGSTRDQGDDNGYSRIDDGDPTTYWKSDPYLTSRYTGDPDSAHPQWAVIDLDQMHAVDGIRIAWVDPYATHFKIQYWVGDGQSSLPNGTWLQPGGVVTGLDTVDAVLDQSHGTWHDFPDGDVGRGRGGSPLIRLSHKPVQAHWVRVLMDRSSGTCDSHGAADPRDCVGYAIQDISVGLIDAAGALHDLIRHTACGGDPQRAGCAPHQSTIFVSSVDPWHSAADRVREDQDQPGLDIVSNSPITHGLPVMYPVPLWYSTPQNAANEVRYLEARHYKIGYVEMGEEVDGQYAIPEDYAALYVEFADAIHTVDPTVRLGGPVFEGVNSDITVWRDQAGDASWFHRFLAYLRSHRHAADLSFMSYEHYPFRGCDQGGALYEDLIEEPALVKSIVNMWHADGLPRSVPMFMTEDNFANDGGPVPKQLEGALWMADWIGSSLSAGVAGVNYYQYEIEPTDRKRECAKYGGYGVYIVDENYRVLGRGAQFYAAQMLAQQWLEPGDAPHGIYPATTDLGSNDLTAYAAKRPDGTWSVMLVNKDDAAHRVRVSFGPRRFDGPVTVTTFGTAQYYWSGDLLAPPARDNGLSTSTAIGDSYEIPAKSITVLRARITGGGV
jgi:hypothetical protein